MLRSIYPSIRTTLARHSNTTAATTMSALTKVANVVQKAAVAASLGMVGYHIVQIANNVRAGRVEHETMESTYFNEVQKKVDEEYETKYGKTDRRDWYDKDDQSYLKDVPRGVKPKAHKEGQ